MEALETVKTVLAEMTAEAGKSVTEGELVTEIGKRGCNLDYYEKIDALKSVYGEMGLERTEPHTGKVIRYFKPKKEPEQQETTAMKMAKKAAQSNVSERRTAAIINSYRR